MDDVRPNRLMPALAGLLVVALAWPGLTQEAPEPRPDNLVEPSPDNADIGEAPPPAPLTHGLAGPFLAARMSAVLNDLPAAAHYFPLAAAKDEQDGYLQDGALAALLSAGEMDRAETLALDMASRDADSELSDLVIQVSFARAGDWNKVLEITDPTASDKKSGEIQLLEGVIRAWALLGAGSASDSLKAFENLAKQKDIAPVVKYHLGLARAMVGDYEGAEKLLAGKGAMEHPFGLIARLQILVQLDRQEEALKLLDSVQGIEVQEQLVELRKKIAAGEPVMFDVVKTPADGVAQLLLTFATALAGSPEPQPLALIHARLAAWLSPDLADAHLMVAQLLQQQQQFDLAEPEFETLRRMGEMRPVAELSRIDALARADRSDEAEKVALALTATYPDLPQAWIALGDLLRQQEKFSQAVPAYDKALTLLKDASDDERWFALYARGIALERAGKFERAEKDLLAAIEIRPDQASLLNYLGYSWIDRNVNLDRGLDLIRRAVELSPEDGYILDSLAWAYFRLGQYDKAVAPMEKAIGSMSSDPLVNDHLGDIYWMVGRQREAEIQWQRALSLESGASGEVDPDRIRAKLDQGLEAVLLEETSNGTSAVLPKARAEAKDASQPSH